MPYCQKCGASVADDATVCPNCGNALQSQQPSTSLGYQSTKDETGRYAIYGYICAFLSLIVVPEIFGPAAIVLGAYTWRMERDGPRKRGFTLLILGIVCMIVGMYFTSYFALIDLIVPLS